MKKATLIAALAAALPASFAFAAPAEKPVVLTLPAQEVRSTSLNDYAVSREAFRDFQGEYRLANGGMLRLVQHGNGYYAQISGQPRIEVRAATGNTFVSSNGRTELSFEQNDIGTVTTVKLTQARIAA